MELATVSREKRGLLGLFYIEITNGKSIERFCAGWKIIAVDSSKSAAKQIKSVGACLYVPFRRVLMRDFNYSFHMSGLMLSTDPLRLRNCSNFI